MADTTYLSGVGDATLLVHAREDGEPFLDHVRLFWIVKWVPMRRHVRPLLFGY